MLALRRALDHPYIDILVASILIATSLAEGWGTFQQDLVNLDVGAHHGVLLLASST